MLLEAEFLAILLILVYVGAVMVLFLFVVMMLDIKLDVIRHNFRRFVPMACVIGSIIVVEFTMILWYSFGSISESLLRPMHATALSNEPGTMAHTRLIGKVIYSEYIFAFEVAGLVLLVAIIAAVALTTRHLKTRKRQVVSEQVRVRPKDRVYLVKMLTEKTEQSITNETTPDSN